MTRKLVLILALLVPLAAAFPVRAATWYADWANGGTRVSSNFTYGMCDGTSDTAYPGTTNNIWYPLQVLSTSYEIVDTNGDYETVTTAGTGGDTLPAWPAHGSSGATTTDGTVTWTSGGAAPYNQHCPFKDMRFFWADGTYTTGSTFPGWGWIGAGGDTYIVEGTSHAYRIGYSGPNANDYYLSIAGGPTHSPPAPLSGTAGAHTVIEGSNFASCTSDSAKTPLQGGYSVGSAFYLYGTNYVDVKCFDISDHSACGRGGQSNACATGYPMSDFMANGITWYRTTTNTTVTDVKIHGTAVNGMFGATGDGVQINRVKIYGNADSGWNMDNGDGTTGTGTIIINGLDVEWNGCAEEYPIVDAIPYSDCTDDNSSGYGDGIGTASVTSSPAWIFNVSNSTAAYNTQDGFDLLHLQGGGSTLTITNSLAYANMGQQLKVGAAGTAINNVLVGNCNAMRFPQTGTPTDGITVSSYAITTNVLYLTTSTQSLVAGQRISLNGFPTSTFLNGVTFLAVSATGLSSTTIQVPFTHADVLTQTESGKIEVWNGKLSDFCRAADTQVAMNVQSGATTTFAFNTIYSANATAFQVGCNGASCDTTTQLVYKDNVFLGFLNNMANGYPGGGSGSYSNPVYLVAPLTSTLFTNAGSSFDHNLTYHYKNTWTCPSTYANETNGLCVDPQLGDENWSLTGLPASLYPLAGSPLINAGVSILGVSTDYYGASRTSPPWIGAVNSLSSPVAAPGNVTGTVFQGAIVQ